MKLVREGNKFASAKLGKFVYEVRGTRYWGYAVYDLVKDCYITKECFAYHADAVKYVKQLTEYV